MFGKTRESSDTDDRHEAALSVDDFFGDETAVAEAKRVDQLRERVEQVEHQINSQFTSMAAYAQIAQEQIELVRSEAQHVNERSEQRVVGLIERERADRISDSADAAGPDVIGRLDALETQVAEIQVSLQQCLASQKALADAIIDLFQPNGAQIDGPDEVQPGSTVADEVEPMPEHRPVPDADHGAESASTDSIDGPIAGLSLD